MLYYIHNFHPLLGSPAEGGGQAVSEDLDSL